MLKSGDNPQSVCQRGLPHACNSPEKVLGTDGGVTKWAATTGLFHRRYRTFGMTEGGEEDGA